jgi:flagellar motility protein MotE (MotC chaperone)
MKEISQIEIYEALKGKLGENEAKLLVGYIESKKKEVATKEDIQRLEQSTKEDIQRLEQFVKEEIRRVEKSTKEDIQRLEKRAEKIENEINDLKKEQRRNLYWILGVYITLWATTIASIITLFLRIKP